MTDGYVGHLSTEMVRWLLVVGRCGVETVGLDRRGDLLVGGALTWHGMSWLRVDVTCDLR